MKCNKCNHTLPDDSEFCQYCGNRITGFAVSEIIEDGSNDIENMSSDDVLNVLITSGVKAAKEAYEANSQNQPNNETDFDFGLVPEKPIYTLARKSVDGEIGYLSKLRTPKGEKIKWNRRGSTSVEGINGVIDIYDIYLMSGQKYTTIYINMYGAKASKKMPTGFGRQKVKPIKSVEKTKNSKWQIVNIFVLALLLTLSVVGFSYSMLPNEEIYSAIICFCIIAIVFKILNTIKFKNNILFNILMVCSLLIMLLICCIEDFWDEDELVVVPMIISVLYLWICEVCQLVKICTNKYYGSKSYKMKCYKKINVINEYREKGVITEKEYEETRKQIISKIH